MWLYAQIGNNGMVVALSQLSGEVLLENMILIDDEISTKIGLGWYYINGKFVPPVYYAHIDENDVADGLVSRPSTEPQLTQDDMIPVETPDYSLIGKKFINGVFCEFNAEVAGLRSDIAELKALIQKTKGV